MDTNILIYAHDPRDKVKQDRADHVLGRLAQAETGALSVQALAEFFSAFTGKLRGRLPIGELMDELSLLAETFTVLSLTPMVVLEAARGVRDHHLSYWDAQMWALAKLNQIPTILTEDFTNGAVVEGVTYVNPFKPGFDPISLGT